MKTHHWSSSFFILSLEFWSLLLFFFPSAKALNAFQLLCHNASTKSNSRRILHQPLFPAASAPAALSPPPPPPDTPSSPDIPFFNENPPGPPPADLNQQPAAAATANGRIANPTATQPAKPFKTVAIVVSVAFVTCVMLFLLAFFLYKQTAKQQPPETTQKLVAAQSRNELPTAAPPSSLYYIGTVDPSRVSVSEPSKEATASEMNRSSSSYRKLNSKKVSERYRPSPELQPLPPLSKTVADGSHPPPAASSSSSSDDEENSRETAFHSPQASSSLSLDDGYQTPVSRHSYFSNGSSSSAAAPPPVPFSKRTSPKSRISASSDTKMAMIIPPIKHAPPPSPSPPQQESISGPSRRPRFAAPPPAPNLTHIHSNMSTNSINPPPPPPPPPPPRKVHSQAINLTSSWSSSSSPASRMQQESWSRSQVAASAAKSIAKASEEFSKMKRVASSEKVVEGDDVEGGRPKLKALHWDKVRATSERATVWDQLKSSSFQLNEDMMESLFGCGGASTAPKETVSRKSVIPTFEHENRVLDPKKSQNIAIMLRALNVTRDEVSEALLDGNPEGLGAELLETLVKMAPTKEEEIKLKSYDAGLSKLGSAERFLKNVLDIPFAFKRVEAMLHRANFDTEVNYLRKSFQTLETASEELKSSRLFLKLLEAVLRTGNRMNVGTYRGDATAFKLDTLLKLVDIKGTDGKTTLLHFVVQEIIRTEGSTGESSRENVQTEMNSQFNDEEFRKKGLQVVAGLSRDLGNVKKAAGMDSEVLSSYVSKLESGLNKVRLVLQHEKPDMQGNFFNSMKLFSKEAEAKIVMIKSDERKALFLVKEVTEYFHGNTAKEEAHPFRIFMIVRDFLNILDQVCKDVGKMQERTVIGSARSFRIAASASLPVLNRYRARQDTTSSDEDSSSP